MAHAGTNFYHKIETVASNRIKAMVNQLTSVSACAGIRDKTSENGMGAAEKAYLNHYGSFSKAIPARKWVDMATVGIARSGYTADLQDDIEAMIKDSGPTQTIDVKVGYYGKEQFNYHMASIFSPGVRARTIHNKIAEQMYRTQRESVLSRNYRAGPSYGNDPYNNAVSTIRKKGFNSPLIATQEMFDSIEWWTEPADKTWGTKDGV